LRKGQLECLTDTKVEPEKVTVTGKIKELWGPEGKVYTRQFHSISGKKQQVQPLLSQTTVRPLFA
jgi:hypothetical protein